MRIAFFNLIGAYAFHVFKAPLCCLIYLKLQIVQISPLFHVKHFYFLIMYIWLENSFPVLMADKLEIRPISNALT